MKNRIAALLRKLERRQQGDRPTAVLHFRRGEPPPDAPPGHDGLWVEEVVVTVDPQSGQLLDCHGHPVRVDASGRMRPPPE